MDEIKGDSKRYSACCSAVPDSVDMTKGNTKRHVERIKVKGWMKANVCDTFGTNVQMKRCPSGLLGDS